MSKAAQLHWYRTESHASPLGFELRAQHRGRTWRMYRLADGQWRVKPTDRPQQERTFVKPEDARKYAAEAAMTNPRRKRNPQEAHMASKTKNPTRPGHWKVEFTTSSGQITDSPRLPTKKAAEDFRDEQLRTTGPYHEKVSAQIYEYMDNGSYRARGKPKVSPKGRNPMRGSRKAVSTEVDEQAAQELRLYIDHDGTLYRQRRKPIEKNLVKKWKKGTFDVTKAVDAYMYLVDAGAKKYAHDFGGVWNEIFPKATRRYVADEYATDFNHDMSEDPTAFDDRLDNPAPVPARRRKNPGGRRKNGAGLGALIGSTIGTLAGFGAASIPLAALGSLAGGTIGGYIGAPKDRKKRGAAGGAIGGALLGPVGAGIGGYVGGTKADKDYGGRRNNPSRKALRESNPSSCGCSDRTTKISRRLTNV